MLSDVFLSNTPSTNYCKFVSFFVPVRPCRISLNKIIYPSLGLALSLENKKDRVRRWESLTLKKKNNRQQTNGTIRPLIMQSDLESVEKVPFSTFA